MRLTSNDLDFSYYRTKRDVFESLFPGGAEVTAANALRLAYRGFGLRWIAEQILPQDEFKRFAATAHKALDVYFFHTALTRQVLAELQKKPNSDKVALLQATEAHRVCKDRHWAHYLGRIAETLEQAATGIGADQ